jgi:hypothetical protein
MLDAVEMRREVEIFSDGQKSVCCYDSNDVLCRIETLDAKDNLKVSIDYTFDKAGNNVERVVRDPLANVLRRIILDETSQEVGPSDSGPVRWKSMDGTDEAIAVKGQEDLGKS